MFWITLMDAAEKAAFPEQPTSAPEQWGVGYLSEPTGWLADQCRQSFFKGTKENFWRETKAMTRRVILEMVALLVLNEKNRQIIGVPDQR